MSSIRGGGPNAAGIAGRRPWPSLLAALFGAAPKGFWTQVISFLGSLLPLADTCPGKNDQTNSSDRLSLKPARYIAECS